MQVCWLAAVSDTPAAGANSHSAESFPTQLADKDPAGVNGPSTPNVSDAKSPASSKSLPVAAFNGLGIRGESCSHIIGKDLFINLLIEVSTHRPPLSGLS